MFRKLAKRRRLGNQRVYLDYAAATPLRGEVKQYMDYYWSDDFSNTGAMHADGRSSKDKLDQMRKSTASIIGSKPNEIVFTSGGTESNSLAIRGIIEQYVKDSPDKFNFSIITSKLEHPSVTDAVNYFGDFGGTVHLVDSTADGVVNLEHFRELLATVENPLLVSVMMVNNEIGTVQPIKEIGRIIKDFNNERESRVYFHTDGSQAPLYEKIHVDSLGVDMLTLCGQKLYGPKGSGALYVRDGVRLQRQMLGGKQENGLRGGTSPMPLIAGFVCSMEIAERDREQYVTKMEELKNYFLDAVLEDGTIELNGARGLVTPLAINLSFLKTEKDSEQLLVFFDTRGFSVSSKSACIGSDVKTSVVVESLGTERPNSIRFSFGDLTRKSDIDKLIRVIQEL